MFSFGVVMWELLTGEEPYADMHYGAIIGRVLECLYSISFDFYGRYIVRDGKLSCNYIY